MDDFEVKDSSCRIGDEGSAEVKTGNRSPDEVDAEYSEDRHETEQTERKEIIEELVETVSEMIGSEEIEEETSTEAEPEKAENEPNTLDRILETQQQLLEEMGKLNERFDARIMHVDYEEKIVDNMHKELQKHKDDLYFQFVRPILMDIIEVRDSIMRMSAAYLLKSEGERDIPNETFSGYSFDLQDILEKNSVEIYRSEQGEEFTPVKQTIIKKIETEDPSSHGKVAESYSCGYSYNGRTISAEKIAIYCFKESSKNNENSEVIENGQVCIRN